MEAVYASGPGTVAIGDAVMISGHNCNLPGRQTPVALAFSGDSPRAGTAGGVELPPIPIDRDGNFTTTFRIPAALLATQGYGGGPVMPGEYRFISYPPQCIVTETAGQAVHIGGRQWSASMHRAPESGTSICELGYQGTG
jgi:hypothetical protein